MLHITGLVAAPQHVTYDELDQGEFAIEGHAVRLIDLIDRSQPHAAATHATLSADAGGYTASVPLTDIATGGRLFFRDDLGPLAPEDGGPFRAVIEGGATLCWNVKRVDEIRVTAGKEADSVPENPGH